MFLWPFHSCAPCIFISYCCLCQCQAVCYYMPVPTKYHWNISFQKKCSRDREPARTDNYVWEIEKKVVNLSHKLCYISGIFDSIFRWTFFLERDISMIFCGHRHIRNMILFEAKYPFKRAIFIGTIFLWNVFLFWVIWFTYSSDKMSTLNTIVKDYDKNITDNSVWEIETSYLCF
jgi:hypothetical protein